MLASRRFATAGRKAVPQAAHRSAATLPTAGGVGKKSSGMWAALADSESESDTAEAVVSVPVRIVAAAAPVPVFVAPTAVVVAKKAETAAATTDSTDHATAWRAMMESDPFFLAMERGEMWGDLLYERPTAAAVAEATTAARAAAPAEEADPLAAIYSHPYAPLRAREADIWEQPFAGDLEEYWPDTYDTREMSDADYHALMGWLFSKGWHVEAYDRAGVQAYPDNATALRWNPATMEAEEPNRVRWADEEAARAPAPRAHAGCGHSHRPAPAKKGAVTIPRFCREGAACAEAGGSCRYVHGDTIPRVNEPCAFGAGCGASDPTGVKRSQCLRMHPGEEWSPELVIRRL